MFYSINAVNIIKLPSYLTDSGNLIVMEGLKDIPFMATRVFTVRASVGAIRGQHAHKFCTQFLTCPIGSIEVCCYDGREIATYILDKPCIGILIPPSIWAQQTYLTPDSVLTVLCDRPYEEHDYIRDYNDFKIYRISAHNFNLEDV